jgi:hypothetical protein
MKKLRKKLTVNKVTISNLSQIEMKDSAGGNSVTCIFEVCGSKFSACNSLCWSICWCDTFTCDTECNC